MPEVYKHMQKMKFSYITSKPILNKQDKVDKKTLKNLMKLLVSILNKSYSSLMNRGGCIHLKVEYWWSKKGVRTQVKVELNRQKFSSLQCS